ncbi:hypothetical protein [Azospirillum doebereinerae]|uniref:Uncharacterized protein n=1 Tax=Azospirillum doebereinerae TaxID=92933 RepID=A0A3S0V2P6_9PROT|nr:hypothetical protein [Azospirillum doebereinerae]RUQ61979.1 hypothetical protein EJ913_29290 [Azospirillum doebereinerae]
MDGDEQAGVVARLVQWNLEEARSAEQKAAQTALPKLRQRLLDAGRMYRECAELARMGLS